jgi:hypothetical protein
MNRPKPKLSVIKALFAKSGNNCAFPNCSSPLVSDANLFVAQVCHIAGERPESARYDPNQTTDERRSIDNLIVLCYPHHREIDAFPDSFPARALQDMNSNHESRFAVANYDPGSVVISEVEAEVSAFWSKIDELQSSHWIPSLAIQIDSKAGVYDLICEIRARVNSLQYSLEVLRQSDETLELEIRELLERLGIDDSAIDSLPYWENPLVNRNWETHNLAVTNVLEILRLRLLQAEVLYLEETKTHGQLSDQLFHRLSEARTELKGAAKHAAHVD